MTMRFVWVGAIVAVLLVVVLTAGVTAPSARETGSPARLGIDALPATITVKTVTVGKDPSTLTYNPSNQEVYVVSESTNNVSAINATTYAVTKIAVGSSPLVGTYGASNKDVYVENSGSNSISVISSANKVIKTIKLPGYYPETQAYDPANGDLYVLTEGTSGAQITDINHATWALTTKALPSGSEEITYDNASSSLVVSCGVSNELAVISATNVVTLVKLTTGLFPEYAVYNPSDKDLYVSDIGESKTGTVTKTGNVSVLSSSNKIIATVKVGSFPTFPVYDPSSHDIYQINTGQLSVVNHSIVYPVSTVSIIGTTNKVLATVTLGKYAVIGTYDPKNNEMYISCTASNKTYAIDSATNAIAATVATKQNAVGAEYDPALGDEMALGFSTFTNSSSTAKTIVTVIPSTNTGTSTITLGTGPAGGGGYIAADSGFWLVNEGGTTVSVVL
jgi:YVTN family beta-propeller protein